jgi:hypothetical protein
LQELDQQSNSNDGERLRHDRGEHREKRRSCANAKHGEGEAKKHGDYGDHEADEREFTSMRGPVTQHAKADQDRKAE